MRRSPRPDYPPPPDEDASGKLRSEPLGEVPEREWVAVLDVPVPGVDELEGDVGDADLGKGAPEGLGAEVEVRLVARARVDPDPAQPAERVRVARDHPYRIPREPALPDLGHELARLGYERQPNRAVLVSRVAGGHAPGVQERVVGLARERRPRAEVGPEPLVGAVVVVAERPRGVAEVGEVADLEERVARVRRERAEAVGPEHGRDHRAVAAARVAHHPAVRRLGERPVALVDVRDDLVAEVAAVATGARGVDELA